MEIRQLNRWMVLALAVWMQTITVGICTYSFAFFVVPWIEEFGSDRGTLMLAATGSTIGTAVLSPFCGHLLDSISSRALVLVGGGALTLGFVAAAIAPNAIVIILIFVLLVPFGLVLAGTLMATSLVARSFTDGRGLGLGIAALGTSLGGVLMPLLITLILAEHDWRTLFLGLAGIVLAFVMLPAWIILKPQGKLADRSSLSSTPGPELRLTLSPAVFKAGYAFLAPAMLFVAVLHNLGALAEDLAVSQQRAAWIVSTASILMAISKVIFGVLSDRIAHWMLYGVAILSQLAGVILMCLAPGFTPLLVGVTLIAVGAGSMLPVISSLVATRWGEDHFGRVMGVVLAMAGLSGLGPMFAGVMRDAGGSYDLAFVALAALLVPAAWCLCTIPDGIKVSSPEPGPKPIE